MISFQDEDGLLAWWRTVDGTIGVESCGTLR